MAAVEEDGAHDDLVAHDGLVVVDVRGAVGAVVAAYCFSCFFRRGVVRKGGVWKGVWKGGRGIEEEKGAGSEEEKGAGSVFGEGRGE